MGNTAPEVALQVPPVMFEWDGQFVGTAVVNNKPSLVRHMQGDQFEQLGELEGLGQVSSAVPLDEELVVFGSGPESATTDAQALSVLALDGAGERRQVEPPSDERGTSVGWAPGVVGHDDTHVYLQIASSLYRYTEGSSKFELIDTFTRTEPSVGCVVDGIPVRGRSATVERPDAGNSADPNEPAETSSAAPLQAKTWVRSLEAWEEDGWVSGPTSPEIVSPLKPVTQCSTDALFLIDEATQQFAYRLDSPTSEWEAVPGNLVPARIGGGAGMVATESGIALLDDPHKDLPLPLTPNQKSSLAEAAGNPPGGLWGPASALPLSLAGFADGDRWIICSDPALTAPGGVPDLKGVLPAKVTCTSSQTGTSDTTG